MTTSAHAESHGSGRIHDESEDVRSRLLSAPTHARTFVMGFRAPRVPLDALFSEAADGAAMLWEPPSGLGFAAVGALETLRGSGPSRVEAVQAAASSVLRDIEPLGGLSDGFLPRFVGGFSFAEGSANLAPWTAFGDARFFLPEYCYLRSETDACFTVTFRGNAPNRSQVVDTAARLYRALWSAAAPTTRSASLRRTLRARDEMSLGTFRVLVEDALRRIREGRLEKVVAARRTRLEFEEPLDVREVLHELAGPSPNTTRFAVRFDAATFVGTTPERLARKSGLVISTEALAGSVATDAPPTLLDDVKERAEHEFVRREILRRLEPICDGISYPECPEVRRLKHITHLRTPFEATLSSPLHVLSVVERLHPTPAVGGVPAVDAVRWISECEPTPRGWYAAPIGWFDGRGDGDLWVALRSGLITGTEAYLYAGGGIVEGSDPAAEYAETDLKLASLSSALRTTG